MSPAPELPEPNAQTRKLREALDRGEGPTTRRDGVLGQLLFCEGCCCGRVDRGFPPLPKERLKARWKELKLNPAVQLTISGCLGPCDVANVVCLLDARGPCRWFGGLAEEHEYDLLLAWAVASRDAGALAPIPAALARHEFTRFAGPGGSGPACRLEASAEPPARPPAPSAPPFVPIEALVSSGR